MAKSILRATEGYTFHKTGSNMVAMMRNNGGGATANFTCECQNAKAGGGANCRVDIDGTEASCENDGCSGDCRWSIHLPGLIGVHGLMLQK